jgi:hypothetical protein
MGKRAQTCGASYTISDGCIRDLNNMFFFSFNIQVELSCWSFKFLTLTFLFGNIKIWRCQREKIHLNHLVLGFIMKTLL